MQFPWALRLLLVATATAALAFTAGDSRAATREPIPRDPARADAFMIVVNDQNATSAMSRALVSRYFLKKVSRWDSGAVALPVDLPADSPVRDAFSRRVLSKSVS